VLVCHNTEASLSLVQDKAAKAAKKQAAKDAKQAQQVDAKTHAAGGSSELQPQPKAAATGVEQAQQDAKAQVEDAQVSTDSYPSRHVYVTGAISNDRACTAETSTAEERGGTRQDGARR